MGGSEKTVVQAIIKRKIGNPEEPQENARWKVAYDDFVTAMMAFFMVIWLLSSVNEDQRRGIAGYFRPSSDRNQTETGSQSMLDKGILHGGDTLDAAREAKLESLEAQSSSADERHQNAAQKVIKILQGVGPTDTACDPIAQSAAPVLNSQKIAAETAKCMPAKRPMTLNIWTERRADHCCITQIHLQFDASEHIKLKLEPVTDRSIRIEMHMNLNATIERFQRRRTDLKRFFLNQGYHTVEIALTNTPEAKTPAGQSRHRIQAALAEDLSTKPQALTATAALPFGPNAAQRLTLSI